MIDTHRLRQLGTAPLCVTAAILLGVMAAAALFPWPARAVPIVVQEGKATIPADLGDRYGALDGEWELTATAGEPRFQTVPAVAWHSGSATYAIDVLWQGPVLDIELYTVNAGTSYEVWLNGNKIGEGGTYGENAGGSTPSAEPKVLAGTLQTGSNRLEYHVANYVHPRAGLWERIWIACAPLLTHRYGKAVSLDLILFGQMLFFVSLQIFLGVFSKKSSTHIWFGLGALWAACGNLMRNHFAIYALLPSIEYLLLKRSQIASYDLAAACFIMAFVSAQRLSAVKTLFTGMYWCFLAGAALSFLLPYRIVYTSAIIFIPLMLGATAVLIHYRLHKVPTVIERGSQTSEWLKIAADVALTYGLAHDFFMIIGGRYALQAIPYMTFVYVGMYSVVFARDYILANKRVQEAKDQLLLVSEHERRHLADDLHDGVGQMMHALEYLATGALQPGADVAAAVEKIRLTSKEASSLLRHVIDDFNPVRYGAASLESIVLQCASRIESVYGIAVTCEIDVANPIVDGAISRNLQYVYNEALKNAVSHAKPARIAIKLVGKPGSIVGAVVNDGSVPLTASSIQQGHGIAIMRHRIEQFSGEFSAHHDGRSTFTINFRIPVDSEAIINSPAL